MIKRIVAQAIWFLLPLIGSIALAQPVITTQPKSYTTNQGANVSLSVVATGTGNLTYQWYENGMQINKFASNLVFNPAFTTDSGTYLVRVGDDVGTTASTNAVLKVGISNAFTLRASNTTVLQGQNATFSVMSSGVPVNYYWIKNGTNIAGATNSTLTISNVTFTANNSNTYTCLASNFLNTIGSQATLTVNYAPVITLQPVGLTNGVGLGFTLSVGANGNPGLHYQWRTNGVPLVGQTGFNCTIFSAQTSNSGSYDVVITNAVGTTNSTAVSVSVVYIIPAIVTQPIGTNVPVGAPFTLAATANGTAPLFWQWRTNGTPILGATNSSYTINAAQLTDAAAYDVTVTNSVGGTNSIAVQVNVGYPPVITQQPLSLTNNIGDTVSFNSLVTGSDPVSLQWTLNGYAIAAQTNFNLTVSNLQPTNIGFYVLVATNAFGSTVSTNAALSLNGFNFVQWAGLVAYYPLDGNGIDASGNGNNGTNVGNVTAASDRFGKTNGAMFFDGANSCIQCKAGAYFGTNFTISVWINETAYKNWSRILDFGNGAAVNNTLLAISDLSSGKPDAEAYQGTTRRGPFDGSNPAVPLNTWTHLVVTWNGKVVSYFYNGVKQVAYNAALSRGTVVTSLNYIGRSNWRSAGDVDFAGNMDDLRILNRALATNEVSALYALESQPPPSLQPTLTASLGAGTNLSLGLTGVPGASYILQTATDISNPIQWQSIFTNFADTNGVWQFTDTNLDSTQKFYRIVKP